MGIEGGVAIGAAMVAGSVALLGFGLDSGTEAMASVIVIWRFTGSRLSSPTPERRAQQLVAASFFLLSPYITAEAIRALVAGDRAETSIIGMALTAGTAVFEPALGVAKRCIGARLGSSATAREEPRACCAPTWRWRYSPGWPLIRCGVPGGSTGRSRWGSRAGHWSKGDERGPGSRAAALASQVILANRARCNRAMHYGRVLVRCSRVQTSRQLHSQVAAGGGCWLLMAVRGHLGDTRER